MIYVGIDPGLHGAFAVMDAFGGLTQLVDLPVSRDGKLAWIDGSELFYALSWDKNSPVSVTIERVHSMPRQGVASSFQFGVTVGSILSVLQVKQMPIEFVSPSKWKRDLGLSSDKKAALHKARLLYPGADLRLEKHDGRAEALLIAHWSRTRHLYVGNRNASITAA